jgi:hypothetical protein
MKRLFWSVVFYFLLFVSGIYLFAMFLVAMRMFTDIGTISESITVTFNYFYAGIFIFFFPFFLGLGLGLSYMKLKDTEIYEDCKCAYPSQDSVDDPTPYPREYEISVVKPDNIPLLKTKPFKAKLIKLNMKWTKEAFDMLSAWGNTDERNKI